MEGVVVTVVMPLLGIMVVMEEKVEMVAAWVMEAEGVMVGMDNAQ